MKKSLLILVFCAVSGFIFAQGPLPKGQAQINAGVGLSSWGVPVYVGFDYGVHPDISLGAEFAYRSFKHNDYNTSYRHSLWSLSGNANYHFNTILGISPKWDFYAGLNIGFYHWTHDKEYDDKYKDDWDYNSGLGLGLQIGGRYYFTDRFGINLEFGGGYNALSGGKFGISIKL